MAEDEDSGYELSFLDHARRLGQIAVIIRDADKRTMERLAVVGQDTGVPQTLRGSLRYVWPPGLRYLSSEISIRTGS